jgi:hypothetical protein
VDKTSTHLYSIEKEMGYSLQEFFLQFQLFAKNLDSQSLDFQLLENKIIISNKNFKNKRLIIDLNVKSNRVIASLSIPRLLVSFTFENYTEEERIKFIQQFDLSFQRGGG